MQYETVIGLEIHVELATRTKLFCACRNGFGESPNTQVCPVCLGLPGILPVVNEVALTLLFRAGLALDCQIPPKSKFDRKNYFYPDMPKNYQISQYDLPFTVNGRLKLEHVKEVGIERIHMEEDTGKSIHVAPSSTSGGVVGGRIGSSTYTLIDYNRAGVPLIEVVTRPDMRSPDEAVDFLQKLRRTLQFLEVSDCKMEEGRMRCDANVSIRPQGATTLGAKIEIKNMNSFKSVRDALHYEIKRQNEAVEVGERLVQETRAWDETKRVTFSMRSKEEAHDYRYFPEPDIPPFAIAESLIDAVRKTLPELPEARAARYSRDFSLSQDESEFLISARSLSDFFDQTVALISRGKEICNWLRGDIAKYLNEHTLEINQTKLTPKGLAGLIEQIEKGTISGKIAKDLLPEMLEKGGDPQALIQSKGLTQISDAGSLEKLIAEVLQDPGSAKALEEFRAGKERALGFLVGAVMKKTQGKANPQMVNELLKKQLTRA